MNKYRPYQLVQAYLPNGTKRKFQQWGEKTRWAFQMNGRLRSVTGRVINGIFIPNKQEDVDYIMTKYQPKRFPIPAKDKSEYLSVLYARDAARRKMANEKWREHFGDRVAYKGMNVTAFYQSISKPSCYINVDGRKIYGTNKGGKFVPSKKVKNAA